MEPFQRRMKARFKKADRLIGFYYNNPSLPPIHLIRVLKTIILVTQAQINRKERAKNGQR